MDDIDFLKGLAAAAIAIFLSVLGGVINQSHVEKNIQAYEAIFIDDVKYNCMPAVGKNE